MVAEIAAGVALIAFLILVIRELIPVIKDWVKKK